MSNFFIGLWESVFQPGTSPQLVIATHISFFLLLCVLGSQIYITGGNVHFIALSVIALLLWLAVIWFISELNQLKLKSNEELQAASSSDTSGNTDSAKSQVSVPRDDSQGVKKRTVSRKI